MFGFDLSSPRENFNNCLNILENTLISLLPSHDIVLFGGDFNIDCLSHQGGFLTLKTFLNKYGLNQIITQPTRITNNTSTLLDIIVTSSLDFVRNPEVIRMDDMSDHCLVKCSITCKKPPTVIKFKTCRDYSDFDYNLFIADMYSIDFDILYSMSDVDEMVTFFTERVNELFNRHAPYKTKRLTKPPAPWITPNIKFMMRLRNIE